ncbi:MAG: hypothetical protein ACRDWN_07795, partial [Acidimicrobiales bacterium]
ADLLLVIEGGRVVERGTHHQLLAAGGLYAELYHAQFADQDGQDGSGGRIELLRDPSPDRLAAPAAEA